MRNAATIALSALILLAPALAHAQGASTVVPPAAGTASPAPPTTGSEIPTPPLAKPEMKKGNTALKTNGTATDSAGAAQTGADTSTAAPGGQAESSRNGALSTPGDPREKPVGPMRKGNPVTGDSQTPQ